MRWARILCEIKVGVCGVSVGGNSRLRIGRSDARIGEHLMQATLEEATLASVLDQGQCHAIGSGGIFPPAGTAEQIRLRSRQQVIAGEPRITAELLQQVQAGCGPVAKPHRDCAVQGDDGRRMQLQ